MKYYEILEIIQKDLIVATYAHTESLTYTYKKGPTTEQAKLIQPTVFFLNIFIK
jgi:hypothetical protein